MPIYKVTATITAQHNAATRTRLIEAANAAAARNFVAKDVIHVEVADAGECVKLGADGVQLEKAERP